MKKCFVSTHHHPSCTIIHLMQCAPTGGLVGWFTCSLSPFTGYQNVPRHATFSPKFSSPPLLLLLLFHKLLFCTFCVCVCVSDMELCFYKNVTKIHLKNCQNLNFFFSVCGVHPLHLVKFIIPINPPRLKYTKPTKGRPMDRPNNKNQQQNQLSAIITMYTSFLTNSWLLVLLCTNYSFFFFSFQSHFFKGFLGSLFFFFKLEFLGLFRVPFLSFFFFFTFLLNF